MIVCKLDSARLEVRMLKGLLGAGSLRWIPTKINSYQLNPDSNTNASGLFLSLYCIQQSTLKGVSEKN